MLEIKNLNMKYCSQSHKNKVKEEFERRQRELLGENLLNKIKKVHKSPDGKNKVFIFENGDILTISYLEYLKYYEAYCLGFFDISKIEEISAQSKEYSLLKCLESYKLTLFVQ